MMEQREIRIINDREVHLFFDTEKQSYLVSSDAMELLLNSIRKVKYYEDAEKQGSIFLPCSIGEPIFVIPSITNYRLNKLYGYEENNRVYTQIVNSITFFEDGYLLNTCDGMRCVRSDSYNETWFLLESQAEEALKKMQEDNR